MIYAILDENNNFQEWRKLDVLPDYKDGRVRPQVVDPLPVYDNELFKVIESTPIVNENDVRKTWAVVPLSAEELAYVNLKKDYVQAKNIYVDLKNGVGTAGERINRIENVLAFIVKKIALELGEIIN